MVTLITITVLTVYWQASNFQCQMNMLPWLNFDFIHSLEHFSHMSAANIGNIFNIFNWQFCALILFIEYYLWIIFHGFNVIAAFQLKSLIFLF